MYSGLLEKVGIWEWEATDPPISGESRNFKTVGRGPVAVEFLSFGVCFNAPSHIPLVFVVE